MNVAIDVFDRKGEILMTTIFERLSKNFFGAIVAFIVSASVAFAADAKDYWVYFGTSTGDTTQEMKDKGIARSEGIYVGKYDASTGAISDIRLALKAPSSGYIATLPDRNLLYFIGCADPKDGWANAYACSVDPKTGSLTLINGNATTGQGVCHTTVRSDGKFLNVANYSSGDFSVFEQENSGDGVNAELFRKSVLLVDVDLAALDFSVVFFGYLIALIFKPKTK